MQIANGLVFRTESQLFENNNGAVGMQANRLWKDPAFCGKAALSTENRLASFRAHSNHCSLPREQAQIRQPVDKKLHGQRHKQ